MKEKPSATFIGGVADGRTVPIIGQFMMGKAIPHQTVPITDPQGHYLRHTHLEDRYRLHSVNGRHFYVEETIRDEDLDELLASIK